LCFPEIAAADAFRNRFGGVRLTYTLGKPTPRLPRPLDEEEGRCPSDHRAPFVISMPAGGGFLRQGKPRSTDTVHPLGLTPSRR
jgi:hypothetical protein